MKRLADRWWLVVLVMLLAVSASTAVLVRVEHSHHMQHRQATEHQALEMLRGSVDDLLGRESTLAHVMGVVRSPVGSRWPTFAQTVMSQPLAESTGFVAAVSGRGRKAFERRTGLSLSRYVRPGVIASAPRRSRYFVLEYLDQRSRSSTPLGTDVGTIPSRRALLIRSAQTNRQVASSPVGLISSAGARGVVVFDPVRGADGELRGWVSATYRASALAELVARSIPGVRLTIRDGDSSLLGAAGRPSGVPGTVSVAGRTWQVWTTIAGPGFDAVPWLVLGLGFTLTIAVMLIMRQAVVRERYASTQVAWHVAAERERRAELADERRALAQAQTIAQIGSWSVDPVAGTTTWSEEMYRMFNRDPADGPLRGRAFLQRLHPDDRTRVGAEYRQAVRDAQGFDLHGRLLHADGEVLYLHAIARREDDGRFTGTVQDITRAAQLREALTLTSARLQAVLENSPMGIYMRDLDGRFVIANQELAGIQGVEVSDLVGRTLEELLSPDAATHVRTDDEKVIAEGVVVRNEEMVPAAAGEDRSRTFLWQKFPVLDADGQSLGVGGIALDMTARVKTERALRETEERFRRAFDDAPIGMALLDLDGRMTQVNDALCAMLGYAREELVGRFGRSIAHPEDGIFTRAAMDEIRAGLRQSYSTEMRSLNVAGHPVSCTLQATMLSDPDGRPTAVLIQIQDITDRKHHEQQLEHLADHDALTGLFNRRAFSRELTAHAGRGARYGAGGTVLMIDLDQFKHVNDTLGHHAGDELITRVAHLLGERLRTSDVLARLGGDEFAVLLPRAGVRDAEQVAQSVIDTLHLHAIPIAGTERRMTASIGIASFEDQPQISAEDIMINADLAMYDAKQSGRDRYATFSSGRSTGRMESRVSWAHRITDALENDGFTLLAQPIVDLRTATVAQYELLLRMRDDHGDLIPPATFLYIAERLDLMTGIDRWVTSQAIAMLQRHAGVTLEVNLSVGSLGDPRLLELLERRLHAARVAPERLIFEISEATALTSVSRARAFGEALSDLGCRFALDNFGAGLGSFYYLKHLVFDYVKIDGEFIRNSPADPTDQLMISAIVDVARGMGKRTIAQFVADDQTVSLLTRLGVDLGQGYHLGVPAPLADQLAVSAPLTLG